MLKDKSLMIILFCLLFSFYNCETPRNNPLDPNNSNHKLATISGQVLTYRVPHIAVSEVNLFWKLEGRSQWSDSDGNFEINRIQKVDGWLTIEKFGFLTDSVHVEWTNQQSQNLEIYLNELPTLDSLIFYSSIENRRPERQIISILTKAKIHDEDNDIDSVFITSPPLDVFTHLIFNTEKEQYERKLSMEELQINTPEAVTGHEFIITVKDNFGNLLELNRSVIKRIIKEEIETIEPAGSELTSSQPTLSWKPFTPGFPFNFMVEIYIDEISPVLVWQKDNIQPATLSTEVDIVLAPNDYFWIIWCIDEFENRSSSKPEKFYVE